MSSDAILIRVQNLERFIKTKLQKQDDKNNTIITNQDDLNGALLSVGTDRIRNYSLNEAVTTEDSYSVGIGLSFNGEIIDMDDYNAVTFFGSTTNLTDKLELLVSINGTLFLKDVNTFINYDGTGKFCIHLKDLGVRYIRLFQDNTTGVIVNVSVKSSKR
tara:strand:+ start:1230 stop:1709 length:480 start_codon:yes stop_codon:yes gene_type:complete